MKEYRGIAFKRPKTWWGKLFDSYPDEVYQTLPRIADRLNTELKNKNHQKYNRN